jgi:hypothetical protein
MVKWLQDDIANYGVWISIISSLLGVAAAFIAYKKNNLFYAFYCAFFVFLVSFQSIQISADFVITDTPSYPGHYITAQGHSYALIYLLLTSIFLLVMPLLSKKIIFRPFKQPILYQPSRTFYIVMSCYILAVTFVLIFIVIGVNAFLESSRPGAVSGATLFIVALSPAIFPLIIKIYSNNVINKFDLFLFAFALIVTSGFSRIHAIGYLLLAVFSQAFRTYRIQGVGVSGLKNAGRYIGGIFVIAFVYLVYGALRDALNYTDSDFASTFDFIMNNQELSLLSFDRNYRVGIEGMSALSGAITYQLDNHIDYTLLPIFSLLFKGGTQWFPSIIKELIQGDLMTDISGFYWYTGSILPPGIESSYVIFNFAGVILFPLMLHVICSKATRVIARGGANLMLILAASLILMNMIHFVRGSWFIWIGYTISYFIVAATFCKLFLRRNKYLENR